MSLVRDPYVSPSRVRGLFRYLLTIENQTEARENLERILTPKALQEKQQNKMLNNIISECINTGLLTAQDGSIAISHELREDERHPEKGDELLPYTLCRLIFSEKNEHNHDLGRVLAWYLTQNVYDAPGNWKTAEKKLEDQIGSEKLGMNDTRWGQFDDWVCYLGFAWKNKLGNSGSLIPDPTRYLRTHLPDLYNNSGDQTLPIKRFFEELGKTCPVIEGGFLRQEIHEKMGTEESYTLSSVTSFALVRLEKSGLIKMLDKSDADAYLLTGVKTPRCSEIVWLGKEE